MFKVVVGLCCSTLDEAGELLHSQTEAMCTGNSSNKTKHISEQSVTCETYLSILALFLETTVLIIATISVITAVFVVVSSTPAGFVAP
jgi:hypothetical protein